MDEEDEESKAVRKTREEIEKSIGVSPETQESIEKSVEEMIQAIETISERMAVLCKEKNMDPESVLAGAILGAMATPIRVRREICVAVPVDILDILRKRGDEDETDDANDTKVAD